MNFSICTKRRQAKFGLIENENFKIKNKKKLGKERERKEMEKEIRILVLIKTKKEDIKNNKLTIELKNL